jgi:hypothetical protein
VNYQPVASDHCSDCGDKMEPHQGDARCPICFDRYLYDIEPGFLESYRQFGARSRLILAETCLRGLVLESPAHRKVLAMTIFEQYVGAMSDLAGLVQAFRNRELAPVVRSFLEFRLNAASALSFYEDIAKSSDAELCAALGLPLPAYAAATAPHLDGQDTRELAIAVHHLMLDLRKATDQGDEAALALAQFAGQMDSAIIANDAKWLNGMGADVTPDQVAMLVFDQRRRAMYVQGLTADETAMGRVVDGIDTATRAASNLIYAYLQAHDL